MFLPQNLLSWSPRIVTNGLLTWPQTAPDLNLIEVYGKYQCHQRVFCCQERVSFSRNDVRMGFYRSENIHINARTQCFPPEHFTVAVIDINLIWLVHARNTLPLIAGDICCTYGTAGRTWHSRSTPGVGCGKTQRISAAFLLSLWPCQEAAVGVPWRSLQS